MNVARRKGGGNCICGDFDANSCKLSTCAKLQVGLSEMCREDAALAELLEKWPVLPDHIRRAIMHLVRAG